MSGLSKRRAVVRFIAALSIGCVVQMAATGCNELSARHGIQQADKLYKEGRYQQAVATYEQALKKDPDLAIGHHNAGLAYLKLFQPGAKGKKNLSYANKATEHFLAYLKKFPNDTKIITLLTKTWLDADEYKNALAYWQAQYKKTPKNRDVIDMLSSINREAGNYDAAIKWKHQLAAISTKNAAKAKAYVAIGSLELSRLRDSGLVDLARLKVADTGIAALQRASSLDPTNPMVQSYLGSIYQLRSVTHGASWAQQVDRAAARYHLLQWRKLSQAAKKKTQQTPPAKGKGKGKGKGAGKSESGG